MTSWPWPAPINDGGCNHLHRGKAMPDVPLVATTGDPVSLARLPGRSIVFCYPWTGAPGKSNPPGWDDIPGAHGSTPQAQDFARLHSSFVLGQRVRLFGLSLQPAEEQAEFASRMRLPYPVLSDADQKVTAALVLPTFEAGGQRFIRRLTLILSEGRIERVFYPVHPPDTHARDVLAWCGATRYRRPRRPLKPDQGRV